MEACIIICQKNKPNDRKNKVLFIDAKNEVTRKNAESYLEPQHIKRITDAYNAYADIDGFSKVVDNGTIASNRSLISIQSYVIDANDKQAYNLGESLTEWESQSRKMHNQVNQFISTLE